jgi:hypothetical protein
MSPLLQEAKHGQNARAIGFQPDFLTSALQNLHKWLVLCDIVFSHDATKISVGDGHRLRLV